MEIGKGLILDKIKENKWIILAVILSISLLISGYMNYTHYNEVNKFKKEAIIDKINEGIAENKEILKQIQHNIDSIHVEQRYLIEKIDGTQNSIKVIEKQRNEKIKYIYTNPTDSTVNLLSNRYNKLSKDSIPK